MVVVISAIHRMWLYQQAYGFSVQRLMVIAIELWLGAVFVLIAVAGIRMTARWLPHAVLVAGVLALLGVAAMNPERFIAEHNVDRFEQTGLLDTDYLLSLSPDIEPALRAPARADAGLREVPRRGAGCLVRVQPVPFARAPRGHAAGRRLRGLLGLLRSVTDRLSAEQALG